MKKPDRSLRLCLDPRDLNQAIKRNQWYSRTVDNILPELAHSKYFSLLDAKLGYWHVPLDKGSSFLTTFHTPWGKYRWLRLPFGLRVAGDVFQERIDRVLRSVPNSVGIVDDILCHGNEEATHDAALITLLETARANNLTFNRRPRFQVSRLCILWRESYPSRVQDGPQKGESHHRTETTREPSRSAELRRTGDLP